MKDIKITKTILNLFLGASLIAVAPVAIADNNWKQKHNNKHIKYSQKHVNKNVHKQANKQFHKKADKKIVFKKTYKNKRSYRYAVKQRLNNQARKINKGVKKGQLVRWEAKQLRREQRDISNRFARYKNDGRLNKRERNSLDRMLNRAAHNIQNKRNNRITQYNQHRGYKYDNRQKGYYPKHGTYEFVINW